MSDSPLLPKRGNSPPRLYIAIPSPPQTGSPRSGYTQGSRGSKFRLSVVTGIILTLAFGMFVLQQEIFAQTPPNISLLTQADPLVASRLASIANRGQYTKCLSTEARAKGMTEAAATAEVTKNVDSLPFIPGAIGGNKFVEVLVSDAPCWGVGSCCQANTYFRQGHQEDIRAFESIYQKHELSLLYAIFAHAPPKYVLEAGAGQGYASQIFKMIWPRAVLVSLESDPSNFEALMYNTREIDGVHIVHGGLWPYQATLKQTKKRIQRGTSTYILQETAPYLVGRGMGFNNLDHGSHQSSDGSGRDSDSGGSTVNPRLIPQKQHHPAPEDNIIGLSVQSLLSMFDIPAFDFVYLDIEGAEAFVFSRAADLKWVAGAKVIAIKLHENLGKYYGVEGRLVAQVSAAFVGRGYVVVQDGDVMILISPDMVDDMPDVWSSYGGSSSDDGDGDSDGDEGEQEGENEATANGSSEDDQTDEQRHDTTADNSNERIEETGDATEARLRYVKFASSRRRR